MSIRSSIVMFSVCCSTTTTTSIRRRSSSLLNLSEEGGSDNGDEGVETLNDCDGDAINACEEEEVPNEDIGETEADCNRRGDGGAGGGGGGAAAAAAGDPGDASAADKSRHLMCLPRPVRFSFLMSLSK